MKKLSRAYLLIAAFAAVGCVFLLFDRSEYGLADAFRNAVECSNTSSDHCYQLHPGIIRTVQTSDGQEDRLDIDTSAGASSGSRHSSGPFCSSIDGCSPSLPA